MLSLNFMAIKRTSESLITPGDNADLICHPFRPQRHTTTTTTTTRSTPTTTTARIDDDLTMNILYAIDARFGLRLAQHGILARDMVEKGTGGGTHVNAYAM